MSRHIQRPPPPDASQSGSTALILSTVMFTFVCYFIVGLPMAVLPGHVLGTLSGGPVLAGLVIGSQYAGTMASRPLAGRLADRIGPKATVLWGTAACAASGLFLAAAGWMEGSAGISLAILVTGRVVLGIGESCVGTGAIAWAAGRLGEGQVARIISWNGIATYGALAAGAPLGVVLHKAAGLQGLGLLAVVLGTLALAVGLPRPAARIVAGQGLPFTVLAWRILPHGVALALGSFGFGTLMSFIPLFHAQHGWNGAAWCLTAFGAAFVGARLLFTGVILRWGGATTAMASLGVEVGGFLLLWSAQTPAVALAGAALAGLGLSLVFPALGVEVVAMFPASNRGAAVGVYTLFLDVALALAGPLAGLVVHQGDYAPVFLASAGAAALALALAALIRRR